LPAAKWLTTDMASDAAQRERQLGLHKLIVCMIAAILLILLAAVFLFLHPEPLLKGKPAAYWLAQLENGSIPAQREVRDAFDHALPDDVPFLLKAVRIQKRPLLQQLKQWWWDWRIRMQNKKFGALPGLRLTGPIQDGRFALRWFAAQSLERLGPNAPAAGPVMIGLLRDKHSTIDPATAVSVLSKLGPAAAPIIPDLLELLPNLPPHLRISVLSILANVGPTQSRVRSAIKGSLHDLEPDVRFAAATLVWTLTQDHELILPALIGLRDHGEAGLRWSVIELLERIGPSRSEVIEATATFLLDENPRVRARAARALGNFGSLPADSKAALQNATNDSYVFVREEAAAALDKLSK